MNTRDDMLRRIRAAIATSAPTDGVSRDYRQHGNTDRATLVAQFTERLRDYGAEVHTTTEPNISALLRDLTADRITAVPPGFPTAWTPSEARIDEPTMDTATLDAVSTVITTSAAACAETGTIALDGSPGQGRRALSLVPDRHICLVDTADIVHTVPELLAQLVPTRPLTLLSGPSATSDIELRRVQGVHGPRNLVVVLIEPSATAATEAMTTP
ncbi:LutC/YkgG family protein [Nocardia sp. NPDC004711]